MSTFFASPSVMKRLLLGFNLLLFTFSAAFGQSVFVPLNQDYSHLIERLEIKSGQLSDDFHSNIKPFERLGVIKLTERIENNPKVKLSLVDDWNLNYLQNDSWEWLKPNKIGQSDSKNPILKYLYRKKSDFFNTANKDIDFHVTPIFHYGTGVQFVNNETSSNRPFINTRGVELRGVLNKKLGFYSMLTENQVLQPTYVRDFILQNEGFPYQGFTKIVDEDSTQMLTDFFIATGYLIFKPIKSLQIQFGHDRNFIGSGIRSMILSDFSAPYLQLKANVQVGRMQYMTIFGQLLNNQLARPATGNIPITPKYVAFHHLNFNVLKNLNIGIFESVIFGKRQVGFDPNYLNPVIFYRFVEGLLGSSDNVMVGADIKWNFLRTFSFYGQFVLDEFNRGEQQNNGWWAKKHGVQAGLKYIDVGGISNFDLQVEYNYARPYLYTHFSTYSNYVNYNVPMAHPLGANFKEILVTARVQPLPRLTVNATFMMAQQGEDVNGLNYGANVLLLNSDRRVGDFNNFTLQGRKTNINLLDAAVSYMIFHNCFLELHGTYRDYKSADASLNSQNIQATGTLRWNIGRLGRLF